MKKYFILFLAAFALIFASCSQNLLFTTSSIEVKLPGTNDRSIVKFTESDVTSFTITVTGKDYTKEKEAKPGDYIVFEELEAGTYTVNVKALDKDLFVAAEGSDDVVVEPGKTSTADVYALLGYKSEFFLMSEKGVQYTDANLKTVLREPKGFFNHTKSAVDFGAELDIPSDKSGTVSKDEPVREEPYEQTFVKINDNTIDKVSLAKILKIKTNTKTTVVFNIKAESACNVTVEYRNEKNSRCIYTEEIPVTTVSTIQFINLSQYNFGLENTPETTGLFTITIPREAGKVTVSDFLQDEDEDCELPPPCAFTVTDAVSVVTEAGMWDDEPYNYAAFTFDKDSMTNESCGYITGIPIKKNKMTKVSFFLETDADIESVLPVYGGDGQISNTPKNNLQMYVHTFADEKTDNSRPSLFSSGNQYLNLYADSDGQECSLFIPGYFVDNSQDYEIASIFFRVENTDCTLTVSNIYIDTIDMTNADYAEEEINFAIVGIKDLPKQNEYYVPSKMTRTDDGKYYYDVPIYDTEKKDFQILAFDPNLDYYEGIYQKNYKWQEYCAFRGMPTTYLKDLEVGFNPSGDEITMTNKSGGDWLIRVTIDPLNDYQITLSDESYTRGSDNPIYYEHRIVSGAQNDDQIIGIYYPHLTGNYEEDKFIPKNTDISYNISGEFSQSFNRLRITFMNWGLPSCPAVNQTQYMDVSQKLTDDDGDGIYELDNESFIDFINLGFDTLTTTIIVVPENVTTGNDGNEIHEKINNLEVSNFSIKIDVNEEGEIFDKSTALIGTYEGELTYTDGNNGTHSRHITADFSVKEYRITITENGNQDYQYGTFTYNNNEIKLLNEDDEETARGETSDNGKTFNMQMPLAGTTLNFTLTKQQ